MRIKKTPTGNTEFQFTHPGGVRPPLAYHAAKLVEFQFTHPGGVRLFETVKVSICDKFQFTHPGGVRRHVRSG